MYFRLRDLRNALKEYTEILIYGAGVYAAKIYPKLCEMRMNAKIEGFVVTEIKQQSFLFDQKIRQVEEIQKSEEKRCILIAVNRSAEAEIVDTLKKKELGNYILLSDFVRGDGYRMTEEQYRGQSFTKYIEYMAESYEYQHVDEMRFKSQEEIIDQIEQKINHRKRDEKQIVVIAAERQARCRYIFRALVKRGYRVTVLSSSTIWPDWLKDSIDQKGVEVIQCQTIEDLLCHALQYDPLVYYVLPPWSDASIAAIMIQQKERFGKIALELYDVMNGSYNVDEKLLDIERYALENADGVIWRYFAKDYLEKKFGFHYRGKSIQFIDCCAGDDFHRESGDDNELLKLCVICGSTDGLADRNGIDYQKWGDDIIRFVTVQEIMQNITDRVDVLLHVYIGRATEEEKALLRKVENEYSNFKAYYNIPHGELKKRLLDYDYGIQHTAGKYPMTDDQYRKEGCLYLWGTYMLSMAQKFFDYIDAGMAVIANSQIQLCNYLSQYGVIIHMDTDRLDIDYLKQHKKQYRANAEKARVKLSIENHIDELLKFFQQLYGEV